MSTKKKRKAKAAAHPKKTYRDVISNACSLLSLQGDQEAMDSVMESTKKALTKKP